MLVYLAAIATAEVVIAFLSVQVGLVVEAVVLIALINQYTFSSRLHEQVRHALVVVGLIPLTRLASLALPQSTLSLVYWEGLILVPVVLGIAFTSELVNPRWLRLAGGRTSRWVQALVALTGVPLSLGLAQSGLEGGIDQGESVSSVVPAVVVLFTSGVTIELMFRGLVQSALTALFGRVGVALTTAAFASLYLGTRSTAYVAVAAALGLGYGVIVERTESVVGVGVAHGVLNVGWNVIWPQLL